MMTTGQIVSAEEHCVKALQFMGIMMRLFHPTAVSKVKNEHFGLKWINKVVNVPPGWMRIFINIMSFGFYIFIIFVSSLVFFCSVWLGVLAAAETKLKALIFMSCVWRYWMKEELGTPGPCALMIPERDPSASWDPADCAMENKFICESEALMRSN